MKQHREWYTTEVLTAQLYLDCQDIPKCAPALHGAEAGARRYVRVLQLLGEHPLDRVRQAVEDCRRAHVISAEAIIQKTHTLAACEAPARRSSPPAVESITVSQVHVPLPDLSLFNQLLGSPTCRDDVHNQAFNTCADDTSSESQNAQFFA
jgi:hypothetical protein